MLTHPRSKRETEGFHNPPPLFLPLPRLKRKTVWSFTPTTTPPQTPPLLSSEMEGFHWHTHNSPWNARHSPECGRVLGYSPNSIYLLNQSQCSELGIRSWGTKLRLKVETTSRVQFGSLTCSDPNFDLNFINFPYLDIPNSQVEAKLRLEFRHKLRLSWGSLKHPNETGEAYLPLNQSLVTWDRTRICIEHLTNNCVSSMN